MALRTPGSINRFSRSRLSAGELCDGLGALRNGMLGELTRKDQPDSSLDLPRAEHSLVIVSNKAASLRSDLLEGVVDQGVQDGHGSFADTDLGMDLLQDSHDVSAVGLHFLVMSLNDLLVRLGNNFLACHYSFRYYISENFTPIWHQ